MCGPSLPPSISTPLLQKATYSDDSKTLSALGITSTTDIEVKDLGMQFSYRGVFVIEYLGPILIMLAASTRPAFLFGAGQSPVPIIESLTAKNAEAAVGSTQWNNFVQALAIVMWILHFAKREYET